MSLSEFRNSLLNNIVEESSKTNEKDITLSREELVEKIKAIEPGYLEVLIYENSIFESQKLIKGYIKESNVYFDIPDWDKLIAALNAFYITCYAEVKEE